MTLQIFLLTRLTFSILIMDEIHQVVSKALSEHGSIRILGDVRTETLDPNNYLASITNLVQPFLDTWNSKDEITRVTFLAVDIYIRHAFFVVDLNNEQYDYNTAHLSAVPVPVYLLKRSRRPHGRWKIFRYAPQDQSLAKMLASFHWAHGQDPLPFFEDHSNQTKRVICMYPRGEEPEFLKEGAVILKNE